MAALLLAVALPAAAASAGQAADTGGAERAGEASDPLFASILAAFDAVQDDTATIVARFTEEKRLRLLERPVVSRGVFFFDRQNRVRWEYLEPDPKVFVITEDRYVAYYPALNRAEEVPIKKFIGKRLFRFLGLGQSTADLSKYYVLRLEPKSDLQDTHLLVLTPRKRRIGERLTEMRIWVDAATYLPRRVHYAETGGDSTTITFHEIRPNAEVASSRFHIELPRGVMVTETFNGFALSGQGF